MFRMQPPMPQLDTSAPGTTTAKRRTTVSTRPFGTDMSSRQKKPDARALFKQAKSRKGASGASLESPLGPAPAAAAGRGASSSSSVGGGKYVGKSKEEVRDEEIDGGID